MSDSRTFFSGAKAVGQFQDGILRKKVSKKKHLLLKLDAWGFDKKMWDTVLPDLKEIRVFDEDESMLYTIHRELAEAKRVVAEFHNYGLQVFIPRSAFDKKPHTIPTKK